MYHHAANSKATHRFQRSEINDIHTLSTKQVLKPVKGIAYRPSKKYREELYKLGKANKLIRWGNLELSVQETLQPEPYYLPDVTDHESVLALGYMSYNAYTELGGKGEWYDLGTEWRVVSLYNKRVYSIQKIDILYRIHHLVGSRMVCVVMSLVIQTIRC
jgi:putative lipase involved disintegration of autophagic bodies